jgi:hypothetical protein
MHTKNERVSKCGHVGMEMQIIKKTTSANMDGAFCPFRQPPFFTPYIGEAQAREFVGACLRNCRVKGENLSCN